jgi:hypothetical protein
MVLGLADDLFERPPVQAPGQYAPA